ncbi:MAG: hypothetical protein QNJ90_05995 [Planctomycetota bacterium]|nr:hypothetical protein [Planctomycetota bacterium]
MKTLLHSRRALLLGSLALGALLVLSALSPAAAADKETRQRWILNAKVGPLRTAIVRDATGKSSSHHYMTIEVTNPTKFARGWHPLVKALTDTNRTYLAAGGSSALATIRKLERNPNLVPIGTTAGKIKPGQKLQTVAIFGRLDPLYDRINVQVFGLVDPIATYKIEQYGSKSSDDNVVLGADSVVVDSAYYDHNQKILKRLKKAAKDSGGDLPRPAVEYQEVAEARYWSLNFERLGDEIRSEDDIIRQKGEGEWKVKGEVGKEGGPKGLRVISTEG